METASRSAPAYNDIAPLVTRTPVDTPPLPLRSDAVRLVLNRHATRRAGGLPSVSVLVGPCGSALAAFRAWATEHGHPVRFGSVESAAEVADLFARAAVAARDLVADAHAYLASHTGRSVAELRAALAGMTRHDLDLFFAANDGRLPPGDGTPLARRVCEASLAGQAPDGEWGSAGAAPFAVLSGLAALIPADGVPACLLSAPAARDVSDWFRAAGGAAVAVATHVPKFPLAVAISAGAWARYLTEEPESRVKAVLREGAIELPVLPRKEVEQLLSQSGTRVESVPAAVLSVLAEGVPDTFAAALVTATTAPTGAATAHADDLAQRGRAVPVRVPRTAARHGRAVRAERRRRVPVRPPRRGGRSARPRPAPRRRDRRLLPLPRRGRLPAGPGEGLGASAARIFGSPVSRG